MKNVLTPKGRKDLIEQLTILKTVEFRNCIVALAEAREKGDISENAEFETAKEEFDKLQNRISILEERIKNANVISTLEINTESVDILSTVRVKNKTFKKEQKFTLVPENEIDIKSGRISHNSPIGVALMGKKPGDLISVNVPNGQLKLEILEITAEYAS